MRPRDRDSIRLYASTISEDRVLVVDEGTGLGHEIPIVPILSLSNWRVGDAGKAATVESKLRVTWQRVDRVPIDLQ